MKRFNVLLSCLIAFVGANAQESNLFPTENGWLMFNNQDVVNNYVGNINETAYKINVESDAKMVQTVYADQYPDYPPTEVDPTVAGAGNDAELGSEGSVTGALILQPASAAMSTNGGGFLLCLPACSTLSIDYSSESRVMARILATTNPDADMSKAGADYALSDATGWKIISAKYASMFSRLPSGHNQWTGIEALSNGFDNVTIKSNDKIYVWFQSCTKDVIYIHGVKVTVPSTGISATKSDKEETTRVYTISGACLGTDVKVGDLPQGVYVISNGQGGKVISVK